MASSTTDTDYKQINQFQLQVNLKDTHNLTIVKKQTITIKI